MHLLYTAWQCLHDSLKPGKPCLPVGLCVPCIHHPLLLWIMIKLPSESAQSRPTAALLRSELSDPGCSDHLFVLVWTVRCVAEVLESLDRASINKGLGYEASSQKQVLVYRHTQLVWIFQENHAYEWIASRLDSMESNHLSLKNN